MKSQPSILGRFLRPVVLGTFALLSLPLAVEAKDKDKGKSNKHSDHHDHDHDRDHDRDRGRDEYLRRSRSGFSVNFGTGWRGKGYYYGPANSPYYYQRPDVVYYERRELVPQSYFGGAEHGSGDAAVQRALSRRGYYSGPIDGDIGPGSRRAIARWQADHGLRVTGAVNSTLLRSLGL